MSKKSKTTCAFRAGMCAMAMALPVRQPPQHEAHWRDVPVELHIGYASFGEESSPEDKRPRRSADREHIRALHCHSPLLCMRRGPLIT